MAAKKHAKRPTDPMQLAKLVGDQATAEKEPSPTPEEVRKVMSALGKIGGPRGGKARAASLSPKKRSLIAKRAAQARWKADG